MSADELGPSSTAKREEDALPNAARRRAVLKALAATAPLIITVTPFYARAAYNGTTYVPYCSLHDNRDKDFCKHQNKP
jgi:hypothetical protein